MNDRLELAVRDLVLDLLSLVAIGLFLTTLGTWVEIIGGVGVLV